DDGCEGPIAKQLCATFESHEACARPPERLWTSDPSAAKLATLTAVRPPGRGAARRRRLRVAGGLPAHGDELRGVRQPDAARESRQDVGEVLGGVDAREAAA